MGARRSGLVWITASIQRRFYVRKMNPYNNKDLTKFAIVNAGDIRDALSVALECLRNNSVIAVPTDTIYGLASLAQNAQGVAKLYEIKHRQKHIPIAICVAEVEELYKWGKVTVPRDLLSDLLPGPVTLVFERTPDLNASLNPSTSLVGIRIPDHHFIRSLCSLVGEPLALTSANISSQESSLSTQEFRHLWPQLSLVCEGGELGGTVGSRQGSTVVDLSRHGMYTIVREGSAYKATVATLTRYNLRESSQEGQHNESQKG